LKTRFLLGFVTVLNVGLHDQKNGWVTSITPCWDRKMWQGLVNLLDISNQ